MGLKKNEKKLARSFNFTFCYIDDIFSLHNSRFGGFVDRIYPIELRVRLGLGLGLGLGLPHIQIGLLHTLTYTSKSTVRVG